MNGFSDGYEYFAKSSGSLFSTSAVKTFSSSSDMMVCPCKALMSSAMSFFMVLSRMLKRPHSCTRREFRDSSKTVGYFKTIASISNSCGIFCWMDSMSFRSVLTGFFSYVDCSVAFFLSSNLPAFIDSMLVSKFSH